MSQVKHIKHNLDRISYWVPYGLLVFAIIDQFLSFFRRFNEPLLGMFAFRETQTALSAYWMTQGGPKLIYETPVLGSPYTIPFEFPFFQWATALLAYLTPMSVESAARTVCFTFFWGCIYFAYRIIRVLDFDRETAILFIGLVCLSPLYLYWSSTSMIESMALAFALAWLWAYLKFLKTDRLRYLLLALIFGCMAALEKITTFPPVLLVGCVLTLIHFYQNWTDEPNGLAAFLARNTIKAVLLLSLVVVPITAAGLWVHLADTAKSTSTLGKTVTSEAIRRFNFGTLEQRLSPDNWKTVIFGRSLLHILGCAWFVVLFMAGAFLRSRRSWIAVTLCFAAYLIAPMIFWQLHIVHYYYQYANGAYLIFAAAIIFRGGFSRQPFVSALALSIFSAAMALTFAVIFNPYMKPSKLEAAIWSVQPGEWISQNTVPNSALYVFGIDWSSQVHFYAKRKGIAARRALTYAQVDDLLSDVPKYTGGEPLESVLVCDRVYRDWADKGKLNSRAERLKTFLEGREFIKKYGKKCSLYR